MLGKPIGPGPEVHPRHGLSCVRRVSSADKPPNRFLVSEHPRSAFPLGLVHRPVRLRQQLPKVLLSRVPVRPHADAQHQLLSPGRRTGLRLSSALIRSSTASGEANTDSSHSASTNSSPPQRHSQSPSLTLRPITSATWRMQTSPAWWPWVSFMVLKSSRSTTATVR